MRAVSVAGDPAERMLHIRGWHSREPGLARCRGKRLRAVMLVTRNRDGVDVERAAPEGMEHARRILVGEQAEDHVERPPGRDGAAEMIGDGAGGGGIVGAIEPELRLRREQIADRPGSEQYKRDWCRSIAAANPALVA